MAALGFGVAGCAAAGDADDAGFPASGLGEATWVVVAAAFGPAAFAFAATFFEVTPLPDFVFLVLAFGVVFFADADSSFFSVNSNAGLGRERSWGFMRVISAAGFTPAAAAGLAVVAASAACRGLPSKSGLTITWLS